MKLPITGQRRSSHRRSSHRAITLLSAGLALAIAIFSAAPNIAAAQESQPGTRQPGGLMDASLTARPMMLSFFTGLHYGYFAAYGLPLTFGGRFYIPLVHEGFIPSLNDEFGLEFGLDLNITFLASRYADSSVFGFGVPADVMWDFHITPNFDAYAKLGLVVGSIVSNETYGGFWWTIRSAVGLRLKISEGLYFRAEAGFPSIIAGIGLAF
jgi:hypothetical protein